MKKVKVQGLNGEVEYDENDTFRTVMYLRTDHEKTYEKSAWTTAPHRLIGYDEAAGQWVVII